MTHFTLDKGFPAIPLRPGMQLRLLALNPTTEAEVAGVSCTQWSIYGRDRSPGLPAAQELPAWVPSGDEDEGTV